MKPKSAFLYGSAVLTAGACGAKLLGAVFKIPLARLLGPEGAGHFGVTYSIYLLVLNGAAAGMPLAMSRLICAAEPRREGTLVRTGLLLFGGIGCLWGGAMLLLAQPLADWMRDPEAVHGLRVLAPAVVFTCVGSAFRGYFQGHQQMAPTAAVQLLEALCKLLVGLAAVVLALRAGWDLPRTAGAAALGVTVGAGLGAWYLLVRYPSESVGAGALSLQAARSILGLAVPITLGNVAAQAVNALAGRVILGQLQDALGYDPDGASTLYGIYTMAQTLYLLPPALVQPMTVSVIPAVTGALERKDHREAHRKERLALVLGSIAALGAGTGLSVLACPIQQLLYGYDSGTLAVAGPVLAVLGPASGLHCMVLVTNAILQARGRAGPAAWSAVLGGAVQLTLTHVLTGQSRFGILGAALGTLGWGVTVLGCNGLFLIHLRQEEKK